MMSKRKRVVDEGEILGSGIGLDFGSWTTKVAEMKDGNLEEDVAEDLSCVTVGFDGVEGTGNRVGMLEARAVVYGFKTLVGLGIMDKDVQAAMETQPIVKGPDRTILMTLDEQHRILPELVSKIMAEAVEGKDLQDVVVSFPYEFTASQRRSLEMAAELGNVSILGYISEPAAGIYAYGLQRKVNRTVVVLDLGHSSARASVITTENVFKAVAHSVNKKAGGLALMNMLYNKNIADTKTRLRMQLALKDVLKSLETEDSRELVVEKIDGVRTFRKTFDRSSVATAMQVIIDELKTTMDAALVFAKLKKDNVTDVVLMGPLSKDPLLLDNIKLWMPGAEVHCKYGTSTVAVGAAVRAAALKAKTARRRLPRSTKSSGFMTVTRDADDFPSEAARLKARDFWMRHYMSVITNPNYHLDGILPGPIKRKSCLKRCECNKKAEEGRAEWCLIDDMPSGCPWAGHGNFCPPSCGVGCQNQATKLMVTALEYMEVKLHQGSLGYGVFATRDIPANTFLGIYCGELITVQEGNPLKSTNSYLCDVLPGRKNKFLVNAKDKGNIIRYVNSSHLPNTRIYTFGDEEHEFPAYATTRRIPKGSEITVLYDAGNTVVAVKDCECYPCWIQKKASNPDLPPQPEPTTFAHPDEEVIEIDDEEEEEPEEAGEEEGSIQDDVGVEAPGPSTSVVKTRTSRYYDEAAKVTLEVFDQHPHLYMLLNNKVLGKNQRRKPIWRKIDEALKADGNTASPFGSNYPCLNYATGKDSYDYKICLVCGTAMERREFMKHYKKKSECNDFYENWNKGSKLFKKCKVHQRRLNEHNICPYDEEPGYYDSFFKNGDYDDLTNAEKMYRDEQRSEDNK